MAKPAATFLKDTLPEEMAPALRTVDRFWNMIRFQASGVPSGLHGLFYRCAHKNGPFFLSSI
jgi:hypothetical protein